MSQPDPSSPRSLWRRLLTGNVLWLSVASLLNDVSSEMIFPLLPVFLVSTLGAGPAFLGLVEGVAETTASFVKLAGGWLSDRLARRHALVGWGYGLAAISRPLMAAATAPWHVLAIRFGDRVGKGVRTAPRDALLADSVAPAERGRAFGLHRAADHTGAILGPLLASGLLLMWPGRLRLVFLLALAPAGVALIAVVWRVREIRPAPAPAPRAGSGPVPRPADRRDAMTATATADPMDEPGVAEAEAGARRAFVGYLAVLALFTLGNASDAFLLLRARQLGVSVALVPILWGALHVSKTAFNVAGGALADRVGPRPAILAGWLVYAGVYAGFALAAAAWHAWVLFLVYGLFYGLTEPTEKVLVTRLAPSALRARAFGTYHFAIGIAALPSSLVFGAIWQLYGAEAAFGLGGSLALAAALLLPLVVGGVGPAGREEAHG